MDIPQETIARYQQGGDIYASLEGTYGTSAANALAAAAATGERSALTEALVQIKYGPPLNTSTGSILVDQLLTAPLDAPLDALDSGVKQFFDSAGIKTILTVAVVVVVVLVAVKSN